MADEQKRKDFFISYTNADSTWAEWIAWQLEQAGYDVVLQVWDFHAGGNFVNDMDAATRTAERTIAVLSPDYFHSRFTPSEWQTAFRRDPTSEQGLIVPVRVRECNVEGLLGAIVYIDVVGLDEPTARERLLTRVCRERAKPTTAPAFPTIASRSSEPPPFPGVLPALWTVPALRNPFFTGREETLEQLAEAFQGSASASPRQPVALSGLGGIGKTQIAIEYAYRSSARYQAVFWARAALIADYLTFARLLSLPQTEEANQLLVVQAVKQWLASHAGWLLILDNADDLTQAREFLPPSSAGHVLLTTRAEVTAPLARRIAIDVLPRELGADFLLHRAGLLAPELPLEAASSADQALARQLCDELGGLPLALDQAGAYIQENACRLSDYLQWYHKRRTVLLGQRGDLAEDHPEPVATTWSLSFERMEQRSAAAADLLRLCAFLHPDAIPEEIITQGATVLGQVLETLSNDPLALNAALKELRAYSLVRRDPSPQTFSLHRLVQAELRDGLDEPTRKGRAERVVKAVNTAFLEVEEPATGVQGERLLPHALVCASLIEHHHLAFSEAANLLDQTAFYLYERARYPEAEPLYQLGLAICEQQSGAQHPATARILKNLALLYKEQGKYEQAEPLYQRALTICEQQLGAQHLATARILNNLTELYQVQGKYEQTEPLLKRALAIREQQLGDQHPDTAMSLNNLALLYQVQGKYEQAEPLYQQALAICEQQLGTQHAATAQHLNDLAELYQVQGKYEQAEPLYQQALAIREVQLGPDHPYTAESLWGLASLTQKQGKYEQAKSLYQRALTIFEQRLGLQHPDTLKLREQYAALLEAMRRGREAR